MTINLLKGLDFDVSKEDIIELKERTKDFLNILKLQIKKEKLKADIFLGGSFARKTMLKSNEYDVDVFVRFDRKHENISELLEKVIKKTKVKYESLHGSRDYFQIRANKKVTLEIIPVYKIKSVKDAENTTDLSYFHVNYVNKKLNDKLRKEIRIAKKFFKAQKVYGAESYISGFSGYSVECLIIYYKTFENMIKAFSKSKGKIIIDPEKKYKKEEIMLELNEAKTQSPIILIDPTWKERNVLAALNDETFSKLKEAITLFLKKPSMQFFESKGIDEEKLKEQSKKIGGEYLHLEIKTDKQEGDIAGTKMKKFSKFIIKELEKYFEIKKEEFEYKLEKSSNLYLVLKSRNEIMKGGPSLDMKEHVSAFKKVNKNTFFKGKRIYATIKINFTGKTFIEKFVKEQSKKVNEMDIIEIKVKN